MDFVCFVVLVDEKTSRKAAEKLNMTFTAILYHVTNLENHYRNRLIYRQRQRDKITPHGEIVYAKAKKLIELYEELYDLGIEYQELYHVDTA
jgi:DNA-binding transcriptional LysR family regulator